MIGATSIMSSRQCLWRRRILVGRHRQAQFDAAHVAAVAHVDAAHLPWWGRWRERTRHRSQQRHADLPQRHAEEHAECHPDHRGQGRHGVHANAACGYPQLVEPYQGAPTVDADGRVAARRAHRRAPRPRRRQLGRRRARPRPPRRRRPRSGHGGGRLGTRPGVPIRALDRLTTADGRRPGRHACGDRRRRQMAAAALPRRSSMPRRWRCTATSATAWRSIATASCAGSTTPSSPCSRSARDDRG